MARQLQLGFTTASRTRISNPSHKSQRMTAPKPQASSAKPTRLNFFVENQVLLPFEKPWYAYNYRYSPIPESVLVKGISHQRLMAFRRFPDKVDLTYIEKRAYQDWFISTHGDDFVTFEVDQTGQNLVNQARTMAWPFIETVKAKDPELEPQDAYLPWKVVSAKNKFIYPAQKYPLDYFEYTHEGVYYVDSQQMRVSVDEEISLSDLKRIATNLKDNPYCTVKKIHTNRLTATDYYIQMPDGEMKLLFRVTKVWPGHDLFDNKYNQSNVNAPQTFYELMAPDEIPLCQWCFNQKQEFIDYVEEPAFTDNPNTFLYNQYGIIYTPKNNEIIFNGLKISKAIKTKSKLIQFLGQLIGRKDPRWKDWVKFKREMKRIKNSMDLDQLMETSFYFRKSGLDIYLDYSKSGFEVTIEVNGIAYTLLYYGDELIFHIGFHFLNPKQHPLLAHPSGTKQKTQTKQVGRFELDLSFRVLNRMIIESALLDQVMQRNSVPQATVVRDFELEFGDEDDLPADLTEPKEYDMIDLALAIGWGRSHYDSKTVNQDDTMSATARHNGPAWMNAILQGVSITVGTSVLSTISQEDKTPRAPTISLDKYGVHAVMTPNRDLKRPGQKHGPATLVDFIEFLNELCNESRNISYSIYVNTEGEFGLLLYLFEETYQSWAIASSYHFDEEGVLYGPYQDILAAKQTIKYDSERFHLSVSTEFHPDTLDDIHIHILQNKRIQNAAANKDILLKSIIPAWNKLCDDFGRNGFFGAMSAGQLLLYRSQFVLFHYTPEIAPQLHKLLHASHQLSMDEIKDLQKRFVPISYKRNPYLDEELLEEHNPHDAMILKNARARAIAIAERVQHKFGNNAEGFTAIFDLTDMPRPDFEDPDDGDDADSSNDLEESSTNESTPMHMQSLPLNGGRRLG